MTPDRSLTRLLLVGVVTASLVVGAQGADRLSEAEAEALVTQARELIKKKQLDVAVVRLEKCAAQASASQATCYKLLGSTYAKLATRDNSKDSLRKARRAYERFLELAPPNDESVPMVKKILEQAGN